MEAMLFENGTYLLFKVLKEELECGNFANMVVERFGKQKISELRKLEDQKPAQN